MLFGVEKGKTYNYYDDGKINESRKSAVIITDIIPFDKVDKTVKSFWEKELIECSWLYAKETDFFIKGQLLLENKEEITVFFVRTIKKEWFSIGHWSGLLEVPG